MIETTDSPDMTEAADPKEPIDKIEPAEPIEPTDRKDPIDPIDRTEPRELMLNSESLDLIDQREPSVSLMDGSWHQPAPDARSARMRRSSKGYRDGMGFTMAPAFFSTDLDRTSRFWGALGFTVVVRHEDYMILEHPMGIVIHFGLAPDLVPSENMTNAYLGFTTATEAVALYEEWADRVSDDGLVHAPGTTRYGMVEWGMADPDSNALRAGGPAEPS